MDTAVRCCACGALAQGGGAFLLRAGETHGCFVAPAHHAPHVKVLLAVAAAAALLPCRAARQLLPSKKRTRIACVLPFLSARAAFAMGAQGLVCTRPLAHGPRSESRPLAHGPRSESSRYLWFLWCDQEPAKAQQLCLIKI